MIVMKFGGTSVESATAIERVASIVRARAARKPVVVVYTNSDRLRMCYLFIAEQAKRIKQSNQHDWTEELVSLVFGSGLGETQEIVITPFKDAKFAAFESKQEQDALPEQRSEAS